MRKRYRTIAGFNSNHYNRKQREDKYRKSETTESDKKDNISDTMVTTEEISTVDDNSAKSSTNLESGGEKSQISEREWKDAYIEKIQSVKMSIVMYGDICMILMIMESRN